MKSLLFTIIFTLSLQASATQWETKPDWTDKDTIRQMVVTASLYEDYKQTSSFHKYEGLYETNPLLGSSPSGPKVRNYFLMTAFSHAVIAKALPPGWPRQTWQYGTIVLQAAHIIHNKRVMARWNF